MGDDSEHPETIDANHQDMTKYTGPQDPNYTKVKNELRHMVKKALEGE
jgi:hypothetical protein